MKKLLSLLLAFVLVFSISVPTFAAESVEDDSNGTVTVFLDGRPVNIRYCLEDNYITYAEIGNDVMSVQDNIVYFNGVAIAIISRTTVERSPTSSVEPRSGWIYTDTCPAGASPSDYDTPAGTDNHNITFIENVIRCSTAVILAALISIVPFGREVAAEEVFRNIAYMIAGLATGNMAFGNSNKVYATEYMYSGGIPYTRKNTFTFFSDSARNNVIGSTTCYSSWA